MRMRDLSRKEMSLALLGAAIFAALVALLVYALVSPGKQTSASRGNAANCDSWQVSEMAASGVLTSSTYYMWGVDIVDQNDAWAVGYRADEHEEIKEDLTFGVILHWNGSQWQPVDVPGLDKLAGSAQYMSIAFYGVDAYSSNDVWVVGSASGLSNNRARPLIMHWDGAGWHIVLAPPAGWLSAPLPEPLTSEALYYEKVLNGVSALAPDDVWAVGFDGGKSLTMHWDGKAWNTVPSPSPHTYHNYLNAVLAISSNDVWAAGELDRAADGSPLLMHWNGSTWQLEKTANTTNSNDVLGSASLYGLAPGGNSGLWAVGLDEKASTRSVIIEHWDGKNWAALPGPADPAQHSALFGVVADGSSGVWVGGFSGEAFGQPNASTLLLHWDGSKWSAVTTPQGGRGVVDMDRLPNGEILAVGASDTKPLLLRVSPGPGCGR